MHQQDCCRALPAPAINLCAAQAGPWASGASPGGAGRALYDKSVTADSRRVRVILMEGNESEALRFVRRAPMNGPQRALAQVRQVRSSSIKQTLVI
jgi:hypothetical protein